MRDGEDYSDWDGAGLGLWLWRSSIRGGAAGWEGRLYANQSFCNGGLSNSSGWAGQAGDGVRTYHTRGTASHGLPPPCRAGSTRERSLTLRTNQPAGRDHGLAGGSEHWYGGRARRTEHTSGRMVA